MQIPGPRTRPSMVIGLLLVLLATPQLSAPVRADDDQFAHKATQSLLPFLAVSEAAVYFGDGKHEAVQGIKAVVATTLITEGLKRAVGEERPDHSNHSSFPSGHASAAFAMATTLAEYHPNKKWLAYGAASAISWSRVELNRHYWHDVVAGAALGYFTARKFTGKHVSLAPGGVAFQAKF